MFMVVFAHIEIFSFFEFAETTFLCRLFSTIHMPIFFFISGLCIYRPNAIYGYSRFHQDFVRLILPALIVGLIYTYFKIDQNALYFATNTMKAGYWFTISLFEILLIYYLIYKRIKNNKIFLLVLCGVSLVLYFMRLPLKFFPHLTLVGDWLCLHQTCDFFLYFSIGILFAKYKDVTERLMQNRNFIAVMLLIFMVSSYLVLSFFYLKEQVDVIGKVVCSLGESIVGISGLITFYMLFVHYMSIFSTENILGRILITIGENTLPIYLLHYFLLPSFPCVGDLLKSSSSILCELLIGVPLTLLVIVGSLLMAQIIRLSSSLSKLFLGDKR